MTKALDAITARHDRRTAHDHARLHLQFRASDVETAMVSLLAEMERWGMGPDALAREGLRRRCVELMEKIRD